MQINYLTTDSNKHPKITIGVTTHNRPEFLRECVMSILDQDYKNIEILIGNDYVACPVTFNSLGIDKDHRINIINHDKNIGAYNNNYFLLKSATGDWFTWLADDDLMHPNFLLSAYHALINSEALSYFSGYKAALKPGDFFFSKTNGFEGIRIYDGNAFINEYASRKIKVIGSYGVFKRSILTAINSVPRFGNGIAVYVDTFIPIVAAAAGKVVVEDNELVFLRLHPQSQSFSSTAIDEYETAQAHFLNELVKYKNITNDGDFNKWIENFLWWFALDGMSVISKRFHQKLNCLRPLWSYLFKFIFPHLAINKRIYFSIKIFFLISRQIFKEKISILLGRRGKK
jgi:glycosyltransferase involved in cell wall biosynthesis